jgi:Tol biopolymer transport system component
MRTGVSSAAIGSGGRGRPMLCALALGALVCALALSDGAGAAVSLAPAPTMPLIAYVTQTATSQPVVWTLGASGAPPTRIGAGFSPLVAPSGGQIAASLFGAAPTESGPALIVYSTSGAPPQTYFNLKRETTQPLAWSSDGRYLAVDVQSTVLRNAAKLSGLAIVDTQLKTVKMIARGQIYGASFAPNGNDQLVYGRSAQQTLTSRVNVYRANADGTSAVALTHDGRSLFPLWGPGAIAYDRERLRREDAPVYQIWLRPTSGRTRQLTHIRVRTLVSGLTPIAFSSDGTKLLAQFVGQDTSEAWTVDVASGRARRVTARGAKLSLQAAGLSSDGSTILLDEGGDQGPASEGRVATLPFAGGSTTVLVTHGSQASWNG